ncbi:hypothetical protein KEM54_002140, partial [Ascosphaera aggregata]
MFRNIPRQEDHIDIEVGFMDTDTVVAAPVKSPRLAGDRVPRLTESHEYYRGSTRDLAKGKETGRQSVENQAALAVQPKVRALPRLAAQMSAERERVGPNFVLSRSPRPLLPSCAPKPWYNEALTYTHLKLETGRFVARFMRLFQTIGAALVSNGFHMQEIHDLSGRDQLLNQGNDPNIGSARNGSDSTTTQDALNHMGVNTTSASGALLSTFAPTLILSSIWILIFLACRGTQRRFYSPKSYLGSVTDRKKTVELPNGWFNWIKTYYNLTDTYVLQHVSLDGYFFLRFLRMVSTVCFIGALGTWPILFPLHATGGGSAKQLDKLNFSNVVDPTRYYAHVLVSWFFF